MDTLNIACCTDHNYIMPTGVMICSTCINHKENELTFHVICNQDVTEEDKADLQNIVKDFKHKIIFYTFNLNITKGFSIGEKKQSSHITISTYYRLFLSEILPLNINKVLYLDSDIIVRHSLIDLFKTDFNMAIAAITDCDEGSLDKYNRLRYSQKYGHFNAGVLYINLLYFREHKILQKCIDFANQYTNRIISHDQDILNFVLCDNRYKLPIKYNLQDGFLFQQKNVSWEYEKEIEEALSDPFIIHYTGSRDKPWKKGCKHPYKSEFFKYLNQTKWKKTPLWKSAPTAWRWRIKKALRELGLYPNPITTYRKGLGLK